jgi:hypothetical protein
VSKLDRIGRYSVRGRLGSGAFALVWLGYDDVLEAPVAIKVLAENWAHQLDLRARFVEEARVLRRADSDRVVRVFDIGDLPDGRPYFVMTYADRGTLEERLTDGRSLPVAEALRLAEQVARGVAVVHGLGVIHRDLKPSNVLFRSTVDGRERLLIADLGLSKALAHASGFTVAAGSPGYMAPEQQVVGGGIDIRIDVYGIGAIAYRMLCGVTPQIGATGLKPPTDLRDGLPAGTDSVLARALDLERERRWPSARALADALAELASRVPPEPEEDGDDEPTVVNMAAARTAEDTEEDADGAASTDAEAVAGEAVAGGTVAADAVAADAVAAEAESVAAEAEAESVPPAAADEAAGEGVAAGEFSRTMMVRRPPAEPSRLIVQPARPAATAGTATRPPAASSRAAKPSRPAARRRRWPWVLVAFVLVLAAGAAGVATVIVVQRNRHGLTTLRDNDNHLTITVPLRWAKKTRPGGWDPSVLRLNSKHESGIVITTNLDDFRVPSSGTPGVFVGLSHDPALPGKVGTIPHDGCTKPSSSSLTANGYNGTKYRFDNCVGGMTFTEVALKAGPDVWVYVQLKQPANDDQTDAILRSLRVTA